MKKTFLCLICMSLIFSFCGCERSDDRVETAIECLKEHWDKYYDGDLGSVSENTDRHLQIVNTRIVNIKEEIEASEAKQISNGMSIPTPEEMFGNIDYIVEFELMSDCFGSSPYYENSGIFDCVVVYKDGRKEVADKSPFKRYRSMSYTSDFSPIIESIEDFGGEYDQVLELN